MTQQPPFSIEDGFDHGKRAPDQISPAVAAGAKELLKSRQKRARGTPRWPRMLLTGSLGLDIYRLFLMFVLLSYYAALLVAVFELGERTVALPRLIWQSSAWWWPVYLIYLFLAVPLIYQLARHLWKSEIGLVTAQHDHEPGQAAGHYLRPAEYPGLYAVVADVAQKMDAPPPDRIQLTHRAECYVVEDRNFAVFTDRELTLVLGLPHMAVLSIAELQVILGHELAHFRRGDTSLGVFTFRFLKSLRVAMDEFGGRWWRWLHPLYLLAWVYFHLVLYLSGPLRRYQEMRADGFSAAVFGGPLSAGTLLKDWVIAHQFDAAVASYSPDSDPSDDDQAETVFDWFSRRWRTLSNEGQKYLQRRLAEEERPNFADSHPTVSTRITALRQYPATGETDVTPARFLLHNFSEIARQLQAVLFQDWSSGEAPVPPAAVRAAKSLESESADGLDY